MNINRLGSTAVAGLFILTSLLQLSGCASSGSHTAKDIISGDRPALWFVADSDTQIYLFGTFHVLKPDSQWQSERLAAAMLASDTTYLEADTTSAEALQAVQQVVQQLGLNPPGVTLSDTLGEPRAAQFAEMAAQFGLPMTSLEALRPWLASLTLTVTAMQQLGLDAASGADMQVHNTATAQGDEIRYLESGTSQIKLLASLDDIEDFAGFDDGLAQLSNFEQEIDAMLSAWLSGDERELERQIVDGIRDVSPEAFQRLFVTRNANWLAQISSLMDGEGNYFIAVGAGHLVGEDSVVDMLRQQGYAVHRVQ